MTLPQHENGPPLMVAFYAAVEAIAEGKVAEVVLEQRRCDDEGREWTIEITVRNKVRHFMLNTGDDDV